MILCGGAKIAETGIVIPVIGGVRCPSLAFLCPMDEDTKADYIRTELLEPSAYVGDLGKYTEEDIRYAVCSAATTKRCVEAFVKECWVRIQGSECKTRNIMISAKSSWPLNLTNHSVCVDGRTFFLDGSAIDVVSQPGLVVSGDPHHLPHIIVRSPPGTLQF